MKIRLIALDIDGTLLNPERCLTERTIEACGRAMAAGAKVALSSGRMPAALVEIARALRVNAPAVCFNGGAVCDVLKGDALYKTPLALPLAKKIARAAEDRGMYLHAFIHGGYIAPAYNARTADYEKLCGVKATVVSRPVSEAMDEAPMKLLILDDPEVIERALPALKTEFDGQATLMQSQRHMIECVGKDTSKAAALSFLGARLGIAPEESMAFGDGQNDLDMLLWAGVSYVMDNAKESLKRANARFKIAPSNAEDGVARVIEEYLARGEIGGLS